MPTQDQINKLTKLVRELFLMPDANLTSEITLGYFDADELDAVEFITAFEEEFKIDLDRFNESSLEEIRCTPLFEFLKNK